MNHIIIPARSGSKGIPDKNIKELCGKPLMVYSIETAKEIRSIMDISSITVTTDSEEYIKMANEYGVAGLLRPEQYCRDESPDIDYILHAVCSLNMLYDDMIILLRPTTPIRHAKEIAQVVEEFIENPFLSDSLRSIHKISESPEKMYKKKEGLWIYPYMNISMEDSNKPRQSFTDCYKPNGYVDILRVKTILDKKTTYGDDVRFFDTDRLVVEVDSMEEFEYIEYLMEKK